MVRGKVNLKNNNNVNDGDLLVSHDALTAAIQLASGP